MQKKSAEIKCTIFHYDLIAAELQMGVNMSRRSNKIEKRKRLIRRIRNIFLISTLSFIIACVLGIGLVFYGPLTSVKELFVTSVMTTMNHQYLSRIFLSDTEIKSIMDKNKIIEPKGNTNEKEINPGTKTSNDIKLIPISGMTYKGYLLIVKDPSRISVGISSSLGTSGTRVADIVKGYNAVAGINAGGFADSGGHGTGGTPVGVIISNGKTIFLDKAYKHSLIGFDKNNILVLGSYTSQEIVEKGIRDAITFNPYLILNGKPTITEGNGGWGIAPRTAIGQKTDGSVILLVIDGRQLGSLGATLKDVQDIMLKYGAHNAANLDGGSSTTLFYNGGIINHPCSQYGPRYVPSAFIVK